MDELRQAKHPVTVLAGWYGHPLHPALVHIPIGAWIASAVFDVASYTVDDPAFLVRGASWLIVLGLLGAALAGLLGFLDLFAITTGTRAFRTGLLHVTLTLVASVVFLVDALLRRGADTAHHTGAGLLAMSAVGLLVLLVGAGVGGDLVFRYGVRVAEESDQAAAYAPRRPAEASGGGDSADSAGGAASAGATGDTDATSTHGPVSPLTEGD